MRTAHELCNVRDDKGSALGTCSTLLQLLWTMQHMAYHNHVLAFALREDVMVVVVSC